MVDSNRNQIEEIREKLDIAQVIEKYVALKPAGKNLQGICPFHNEKTPSFIVSPDIQRYKCFGCGKSGDIFNFIQDIENVDFPEALERLAKDAGVTLVKTPGNDKYNRLEEINILAGRYYFKELKADKRASEYIQKRGFNDEYIKEFGIGYAPQYPKLLDYLQTNGKFKKAELLESGLFTNKEGKLRDKFRDRIMFPIRSTRGKVIGFSGRILPGNDFGPKYMNTPETPIFHKKDNIFGQYESRQEIRKQDLVILCEGQTDVISAHQRGYKNIVAPLGTGLTKEQVEKLSKLTKNLLFIFDSDEAGQKAVSRGFKISSEVGVYPFAASPEPYKDIDELLQDKPDNFQKLIDNKQDAFSFLITNFIRNKDLTKLENQAKTQKFVTEHLDVAPSTSLKNYYVSQAEKITKMNFNQYKSDKSATRNSRITRPSNPEMKHSVKTVTYNYVQYLLLLDNTDGVTPLEKEYFEDTSLRNIYNFIFENKDFSREDIYSHFENDTENKDLLENLFFDSTKLYDDQVSIRKELATLEKKIKIEHLMNKQKDLSVKIAIEEDKGNSKESKKLTEEFLEITKILTNLRND
jgi:DNA primase